MASTGSRQGRVALAQGCEKYFGVPVAAFGRVASVLSWRYLESPSLERAALVQPASANTPRFPLSMFQDGRLLSGADRSWCGLGVVRDAQCARPVRSASLAHGGYTMRCRGCWILSRGVSQPPGRGWRGQVKSRGKRLVGGAMRCGCGRAGWWMGDKKKCLFRTELDMLQEPARRTRQMGAMDETRC
jgi:hypothetical protein